MARYLLRKLLFVIISLFVLASATFFLMKAIPGDPFLSEKAVPPEIKANLMAYYGLDKPLIVQYAEYMKNVASFDLGMSMKWQNRSVNQIIEGAFGYSLRLGLCAVATAVAVGVTLGSVAALRHRRLLDSVAMVVAVLGVAVPSFVMATLLQYVFGVKLPLFNVAGLNEPLDYVLPTLALAFMPIAFIARLTRSSMLEVLQSDFIKTAKAKGLAGTAITLRHALRNAILPVVTYLGPLATSVITGSVVIEKIFGIPGLGKYFVESVENRDYTLIMGLTLFYGTLLMCARFFTDVAYGMVDPRIKLTGGKEKA
ncbi:ABC transporter permease [Paenibacillus flagellatus]|uniref:Peptide ABC transporter permease n=1 Tax=Paenibacillus flagellatus TaxID=2211139 RepID=A0A2V5K5E0_9BACL|nr:ABC transporter permease [Paenibacillus flagellatus]PYI54595.1 peptide ABC transporter permease [Paenibacillus flagellatus]